MRERDRNEKTEGKNLGREGDVLLSLSPASLLYIYKLFCFCFLPPGFLFIVVVVVGGGGGGGGVCVCACVRESVSA